MNRYLKAYHNLKLNHKLMIAFTLVAFIPLIFVGVFLTTQMKSMALQQSITEAETQLDRMVNEMEEAILFNDTLHSAIISDSELYQVINKSFESNLEIFLDYHDYTKIGDFEEIYSEVDDIRLYIDNETMLNNMDFMKLEERDKQEEWYWKAVVFEGDSFAGYHFDRINKEHYMVLSRTFTYGKGKTDVIMSLIPVKQFNDMILFSDGPYKVLDSEGIIVGSQTPSDIGRTSVDVYGIDVTEEKDFWRSEIDGHDIQFISREIQLNRLGNPIYVVAAIPLEEILANANAASQLGFTIIIISLILATSFIFFFSNLLTKRMKVLEGNMNKVAEGDFESFEKLEGRDEIGQLSDHLDNMVRSLSDLMLENDRMHEKEKSLILAGEQTRFEMLASQINPHFLFNVLESIRMKAHVDGQEEIADTVQLLGKLMRRSLEMTDEMISVEEELDFIKSYIQIQKFRFSDRFSFSVDADENLMAHEVLPLLLQPIVENAVVHGMEGKTDDGEIHIRVFARGKSLMFEVEDNGLGIPEERLVALEKALINQTQIGHQEAARKDEKTKGKRKRKHIGLQNVNERIKLKYGDTYGLDIESETGNGTIISIILPLNAQG